MRCGPVAWLTADSNIYVIWVPAPHVHVIGVDETHPLFYSLVAIHVFLDYFEMSSKSWLPVAMVALCSAWTAFATPAEFLNPRTGSICSSGIYGELAPILAAYPIAQAFCSAVYPVKCTIAKREVARAPTARVLLPRKQTSTTTTKPSTTTTTKPPTTTTKSTTKSTTTLNAQSSAWSKCQGQGAGIVSTMCSCIEVPKACAIDY
jgi:hypothetical protein